MSLNDKLEYHRHLEAIVHADVEYVRRKDAQYDASWKKRDGVGAFFTIVRPWEVLKVSADRLAMTFSPRFAKRGSRDPTAA